MNKYDNGNVNTSYFANTSGNWNNGTNAGAFHLNVNNSASNTNANHGGHFNEPYKKFPNFTLIL